MGSKINYRIPIFILLCFAYIVLRFWNLTSSCLWFDEIFSVHAAEHDWTGLWWFAARDLIHPPLSYILLKIWISVGGESLLWLRSFPVFFSILALAPFFLICRELKLNNTAIFLALLFVTTSGSLIKYAQEVRMYSLFMCLGLFSFWLFVRYFQLGKSLWLLLPVNVLLVYTHYFGWLFVLSQIAIILIFQNIKIRQMMIMTGLTVLFFIPWIITLWQAARINAEEGGNLSQNLGWIGRPDGSAVLEWIFDLTEPFYHQQTTAEPPAIYWVVLPLSVILITGLILLVASGWNAQDSEEKRKVYLPALLFVLPAVFAFAASWVLPYSIWGARHLIIVFVPLYILAAIVIDKIRFARFRVLIIILIAVIIGLALVNQIGHRQETFILCAFQAFGRESSLGDNAKIYVFEDDVAYHLWFGLHAAQKNVQVIKVSGMAGIPEDKAYFLPRGFDEVKKVGEDGINGEHFWITFRASNWDAFKPPLRNLASRNYRVGQPQIIEAQGLEAFLVEVSSAK